ncbi:MAG: PAS domain-containing protein, partial [Dehalococcoidia bacterium]|nr:PAS domain-containing protein [Dehalococcoidia bacterium]
GRKVYIRYFAVRDKTGRYLGTLEVTQDITEIKKIEGEKRLLEY